MRLLPGVLLLCALCACGADKQRAPVADKPAVALAPELAAPAPEPTGSLEGMVVLAEGAELPRLPDPKQAGGLTVTDPPAPCPPISGADLVPVRRDAGSGGLASIHVALTGMKATAPASPRIHDLRLLEDCRLNQVLLAARLGDSVRITNASAVPLLPSVPGDAYMEAILAGNSRTFELKRLGSSSIACRFGAYCGQTEVLVTSHALFAVSDRLGRYRIDNVPLDQELTLHAWHPLFEESHEAIKLTKDAPTRTVKLVLKPAVVAPAVDAPKAAPVKAAKPRAGELIVQ